MTVAILLYCRRAAWAMPIFLLGCADFGYYNNSLVRIDQSSQRIAASIQVSAPQLYKREALINERNGERDYLLQKLKESETISFGSELVRDVETVSALSAQLGLSFDAGIKQQYEQAAQQNDLVNQIATLKLQAQLGQLQRDLQLMQANYATQTTPSAPAGTTATAVTVPTVALPNLPDITNLATLVKNLTDRLDQVSVGPRGTTAVNSPIDVFQDRQAYRRVLQSSINAMSLDDMHDFEGHSLFRMQFRATVLPGDEKVDKSLGILRMQIKRPELTINDGRVSALYHEWLDHVTLRLNEALAGGTLSGDPALLMLGSGNELFSVVTVILPTSDKDKDCHRDIILDMPFVAKENCLAIRIAVPPVRETANGENEVLAPSRIPYESGKSLTATLQTTVTTLLNLSKSITTLNERLNKPSNSNESGGANKETLRSQSDSDQAGINRQKEDVCRRVQETIRSKTSATAHVEALRRGIVVSSAGLKLAASHLVSDLADFSNSNLAAIYSLIDRYAREAADLEKKCNIPSQNPVSVVPPVFFRALFNVPPTEEIGERAYAARGRPSTYAVTPVELAQHVSTAARAGSAVQIAASLAAILPAQGLGGNAALGFSRAVTGKADALERIPLVVGYSEPGDTLDETSKEYPGFGWLLGPKVVIDPQHKALALEHNLAPYDLTADVVMPGWWPYFDIQYQSEWAPNWRDGALASVTSTTAAKAMHVPRRHSRGDLDGIITLVLNQMGSPRVEIASIGRVEPNIVSGCAKQVTMLIQGTNIWRTQAAYLEGMPALAVSVLPDMAGVSATFDVSQLPQRPAQFTQPKLTLATPNGWASTSITIDGSRLADKQCGDEGLAQAAPDDGSPVIKSVLPTSLYACDTDQRILVQGKNLGAIKEVYLGTIVASPKPIGKDVAVTVPGRIGTTGGSQPTLPLIITTDKGTASKDVAVERDDCPRPPPKGNQQTSADAPATAVLRQLALLATPAGRLDICSKQATLFLTGSNVLKYDRATLTLTKPKAATITAQSVKTLNGQNMSEINFVGLPSQGTADSSLVDASVKVQLFRGSNQGPVVMVDTVCGGTSTVAAK